MTTPNNFAKTDKFRSPFMFPNPAGRKTDDMTSFDHLAADGTVSLLAEHQGSPEFTLLGVGHYISPVPIHDMTGRRRPDLLVALDVDPATYRRSNGYVVSEQHKPLDFMLEVTSHSGGHVETVEKRRDYVALGIREYGGFDEVRQYHGTRLAGERLAGGEYIAKDMEGFPNGACRATVGLWDWTFPGRKVSCAFMTRRQAPALGDERAARVMAEARAYTAKSRAGATEAGSMRWMNRSAAPICDAAICEPAQPNQAC